MTTPALTTWKHAAGGPLPRGRPASAARIVALMSITAGLLAGLILAQAPTGSDEIAVACFLGAVYAGATLAHALGQGLPLGSRIGMSTRYLICGEEIVYFGNVVSVTLDQVRGVIILVSAGERVFELRRAGFVTNARKPEKIEANRQAKFDSAGGWILGQVQRASPEAQIYRIESWRP